MEKRAIIEPGRTPEEQPQKLPAAQQKQAAVVDLDSDFRKRAAEAAANTVSK